MQAKDDCIEVYVKVNLRIMTRRCTIRLFQDADIDVFMEYRNDAHWMRFQGFQGLAREAYVKALLEAPSLFKGMQLAIADAASGDLIGDLYVKQEDDTLWLGYTVHPLHARQGYAYEAVSALIGWAGQRGIATVKATVLPGNTASIGLLEKLGFIHTAQMDGERIYMLRL